MDPYGYIDIFLTMFRGAGCRGAGGVRGCWGRLISIGAAFFRVSSPSLPQLQLVSIRDSLQQTFLLPFPSQSEPRDSQPNVGNRSCLLSIQLICTPAWAILRLTIIIDSDTLKLHLLSPMPTSMLWSKLYTTQRFRKNLYDLFVVPFQTLYFL